MASAGEAVALAPSESLVDFYEVAPPFAYAAIVRDRRTGKMLYRVVEPPLSRGEAAVVEEVKRLLLESQRPALEELRRKGVEGVLRERVLAAIKRFKLPVPEEAVDKVFYYVKRDMLGYGKLDVLVRDPFIEDISCDGVGLPVYVWHSRYESLPTSVVFESPEELESALVRLAHKAGKHISVANPIVEGSLPEGYRLHAALGEVARRGGSFTIRKFREVPFSILDLVKLGTVSLELAAYLWLVVESRKSLMVVGATASGKTTTLNAVATFIRPEAKIVTIEEVPELNLPHENWVPLVARPSTDPWARSVDLFDLLKSALRMRPDYIIVGEVRGEEAFTLFQAIATGHAGMCTMHAENADYAVKRLVSQPMNVPEFLVPLMNVFITVKRLMVGERVARRVVEVREALAGDRGLEWNTVYRYNPVQDRLERVAKSKLLEAIASERFLPAREVEEEVERRAAVLQYLLDRGVTDFARVSRVVRDYALRPMAVYSAVERGIYDVR
ncbi:MAG: type II/IV secretion system ATPase subunit [Thermofilum sp.]|nr:type II/IV secretion system ATPase subunit [Thermofilum sp.]